MPNWSEVLEEIYQRQEQINREGRRGSPLDEIRQKYLAELAEYTGRPTIAYYSGWLDRPEHPGTQIDDADKNGFMCVVHQLPKDQGLDLILHTPGGDTAATESLVDYLRKVFGPREIRAMVPQIAMSGGTMIACACMSIVMGKQSNLGPIDPQIRGLPAKEVVREFERAVKDAKADPASIPIWQSIIGNYHPSFLEICEHAIEYSEKITKAWLHSGMFHDDEKRASKAERVVEKLADSRTTHTHSRHLHMKDATDFGLVVEELEADPTLQDLLLTVHHAYMHAFAMTPTIKIIENHLGVAVVKQESN